MGSEIASALPPAPSSPATPATSIPGFSWSSHLPRALSWSMCALILYVLPIALARPLFETQEARIGVVAREMIERQNYIEPTLGGVQRLNKPPLPYWLAVLSAKVISPDPVPNEKALTYAVLLPEALSGALTVFIVVLFGSAVFGAGAGSFAGLIVGFALMPARYAQLGYPDTALMLGCAGTLCAGAWIACAPRPGIFAALVLGLSMAWAILIKEPIVAFVLPAPLVLEAILALKDRRFSPRKVLLFTLAFALAAALVAPWFYLVAKYVPNGWETIVAERSHIWKKGHDHKQFTFYFQKLAEALLPWTPLILLGFILRRRGTALAEAPEALPVSHAELARRVFHFVAFAALLGFAGFLSQAKQQDYYLLPIIPAIALAAGYAINACRSARGNVEEGLAWFHVGFGALGAAALCYIPRRDPTGINAVMCYGLAGGFFLLCLAAARFWSERRIDRAGSLLGLAGFLLLVPLGPLVRAKGLRNLAIAESEIQQRGSLLTEAPRLRTELDALGKGVQVYAWGNSFPVMNFLLARPVQTENHLIESLSAKTPAAQPLRRVAVVSPDMLKASGLEKYLPPGKNPPIIALLLPPDEELAKVLKKPDGGKRSRDDGDDEDEK